jgi:LuxR family maltose regulon positive regulatory protein
LDVAERAWPRFADEAYEPSVGRAASLLVNVPAWIAVEHAFIAYSRGDAEETTRFASGALAGAGEDERMLDTVARGHLTMATWLRGRVDEAERELVAQIATLRALDKRDEPAWVCGLLGQVQYAQGDLDAAAGTYRQALELTAPPGHAVLPAAGVGYAGLAEVAYQRDDLDAASRHLAAGLPLCRQLVYTQSLARGLATLAWIRHAQGAGAASREAADEAAAAAPGPDLVDLFNPVPAQRARLLLAHGDVDAAARWAAGRGVGADDEPSYPREPAYLVLARVLLAQGRTGRARTLLDRLHSTATAQNRIGSVMEIQALRALALAAESREADALAALTDALGLARPRGHIRVFADEGPPMAALLGRLVAATRSEPADTVPVAYLGRLVRAFQHTVAEAAPEAKARTTGLVATLSERELEVLRLVAAGKQNKEIADQLYVAVDTVKKHVTHILEKLGAANRTQATARARELGLLP